MPFSASTGRCPVFLEYLLTLKKVGHDSLIYHFAFSSDPSKFATDSASESGDLPRIGLEEMLDDLNLEDQEMASDED